MVLAEHEEELILVWKHPNTRLRYVIGRLWRDALGYHFQYAQAQRGIEQAVRDGFTFLDAFPSVQEKHVSDELFPTFARRLPPRWRHQGLKEIGVDPDTHLITFGVLGDAWPQIRWNSSSQSRVTTTRLLASSSVSRWRGGVTTRENP